MKCLLLILAFKLVTSDKLDRSYLPPPGAKSAGGSPGDLQTPLEYPKQNYPGITQSVQQPNFLPENAITELPSNQDLDDGIFKTTNPINYSTSTYTDGSSQTTFFPTNGYDSTVATSSPDIGYYDNFPPKSSHMAFSPSENSISQSQSYIAPTLRSEYETTSITNGLRSDNIREATGYYYGPGHPTYGNDIVKQGSSRVGSISAPNAGFIQYPNQENNTVPGNNGQTFTPKTASAADIVPNYKPSAFGYYGGNPMIMTSQNALPQKLENMEMKSKYGNENKSNLPIMSIKQDKSSKKRPFQTPLVGTIAQNAYKSSLSKMSSSSSNYTKQSKLPINRTILSDKANVSVMFEQRSSIPVRPKLRPERPQAESDRNAVILNYENIITPERFSYRFDTSNGIHGDESGTATDGVRVKGSYSYTGDDGKIYSVTYTADENGFQPRGDHLPTPPPVPEAIKKVIEQAAKDSAAGIIDDGSYDERKYGYMNYQGAMDRYRPFKDSDFLSVHRRTGDQISRSKGAQKRPTTNFKKVNNKELNNSLVYDGDDSITSIQLVNRHPSYLMPDLEHSRNQSLTQVNTGNAPLRYQQNSSRHRQDSSTKNQEQSFLNDNIGNNYYPQENKTYNNNIFNVGIGSDIKEFNPNNSVTNNKIQDNSSLRSKFKPNATDAVTYTDDGYYYIPPIIKFYPNGKQLSYNKNSSLTTGKPIQQNVNANKRTGINNAQEQQISDGRIQVSPNENSILNDSTRKPYFSGSNDQYGNMSPKFPSENEGYKYTSYPNDLDSSYVFTTTPQSTQHENVPIDDYQNQYQTTTYPAAFEQTLPNIVQNRVNIPSGVPGISISQDIVTTARPTFNDGIDLEVNQKVKVFGIGRSKPADATREYPENTSTYNDRFYTTAFPNEQSFTNTYPGIYVRPVQGNGVVQGATNQDATYSDKFITSGGPIIGINSGSTGSYTDPDPDSLRQPQVDLNRTPLLSISTSNNFEDDQFTPNQEQTTPISTLKIQLGPRNIGEDFSGPKQPQRYDPETGYHYK